LRGFRISARLVAIGPFPSRRTRMTEHSPLHVSLVAVPGTLAMPIAGLYEVLTAFPVVAKFHDGVPASPPFAVDIVGTDRTTVTAGSGLPITIQRRVDEVDQTEIIIVPTMAVDEDWATGRHPDLVAWMRRMHGRGAMLCSACTGLGLLAETGLLDWRPATTHWAFGPRFRQAFPKVELRLRGGEPAARKASTIRVASPSMAVPTP
jgi:transcriptional regulator GlxA family with amidase domain